MRGHTVHRINTQQRILFSTASATDSLSNLVNEGHFAVSILKLVSDKNTSLDGWSYVWLSVHLSGVAFGSQVCLLDDTSLNLWLFLSGANGNKTGMIYREALMN